jgi:16S rRNA (uracil1498-N3)-methyltransferase
MIRLALREEQVAGETAVLDAGQVHYLTVVMRQRPGAELIAVLPDGARLARLEDGFRIALLDVVPLVPAARPSITLAQALLKGDHWADCVNLGTQVGVADFLPLVTRRTVVREARPDRLRRWRDVAREAAEQCGRADIPEVREPIALAQLADTPHVVVLSPAGESLPDVYTTLGRPDHVTLVVGPEGGLDPSEEHLLEAAGARRATLGPRILRAENAGALAAFFLIHAHN